MAKHSPKSAINQSWWFTQTDRDVRCVFFCRDGIQFRLCQEIVRRDIDRAVESTHPHGHTVSRPVQHHCWAIGNQGQPYILVMTLMPGWLCSGITALGGMKKILRLTQRPTSVIASSSPWHDQAPGRRTQCRSCPIPRASSSARPSWCGRSGAWARGSRNGPGSSGW